MNDKSTQCRPIGYFDISTQPSQRWQNDKDAQSRQLGYFDKISLCRQLWQNVKNTLYRQLGPIDINNPRCQIVQKDKATQCLNYVIFI